MCFRVSVFCPLHLVIALHTGRHELNWFLFLSKKFWLISKAAKRGESTALHKKYDPSSLQILAYRRGVLQSKWSINAYL
ncbi:hypothetical protein CPB84DRAFT_1762392 [Gymnopilus junonius]|uniref:Secreted protein n=1 Tax=Gymnopilus junonius TaxID=109634 RepID=A0A9P5TT26_GYMJU|nr:hypothetical protein CPB84DRAFT_1762392 [Gymnopilus junonius]